MDIFDRDVLSRSPVLSDDNEKVYAYVSEVMNELIAVHPFREGNGRTAFIVGNFILMQNNLLPLDVYDRRRDQERYYAACEAGRIYKNYIPLASLIGEWEEMALNRWDETDAH
jgi:cell filamentation protein